MEDRIDREPRYAPTTVLVRVGKGGFCDAPVRQYVIHPPGTHPISCPLVSDCTALQLVTEHGSRWWGFEKAWISSELKMVVSGFPKNCEIRSAWPVCTTLP